MTMTFAVEEFLQAGREEEIAESIELPPNKKDDGLPAVLAELTVGGVTKEVWLRKSPTFDPSYRTLALGDSMYEVAFDVRPDGPGLLAQAQRLRRRLRPRDLERVELPERGHA